MNDEDLKSVPSALFALRQARDADPRLDVRPPSPEALESARATLRRLSALQLVELLIANPNYLGYLTPR